MSGAWPPVGSRSATTLTAAARTAIVPSPIEPCGRLTMSVMRSCVCRLMNGLRSRSSRSGRAAGLVESIAEMTSVSERVYLREREKQRAPRSEPPSRAFRERAPRAEPEASALALSLGARRDGARADRDEMGG